MWALLLELLYIPLCFAQQSADTYPNPRTNGFLACGMRSRSYVCDSEKQLGEQERYRLNNDLLQLARRTSHSTGDFCAKKGADATLVITKQGSQQLAEKLNTLWDVDGQCLKAVVFVLSTNDHRLYYAGEAHAGISFFFNLLYTKNTKTTYTNSKSIPL
ncbi:unnamed protein product [Gongylonema pulchrum]|uniref:TPM_phosphatase domain-containing protein n=1 Tax=Gongylonema pulchrum TaxID=637853 RepID=A0A183EGZ5_9BILA|nr:unnamed protein product [Gongylonema pulchrum]